MEAITHVGPHQGLLDWLARNGVDYDLHEHALAFTARETARVEGVDPDEFVKVVGVTARDGRRFLVALKASDHVSLRKARHVFEATDARLMTEAELEAIAPGCELGAIPAVGDLFGVALYADHGLRDDSEITFNAGSHRYAVHVDRTAWESATNVSYADLAEDWDRRPAWFRS